MTHNVVTGNKKSGRLAHSGRNHPYPPSRLRAQKGLQDLPEPASSARTLPAEVTDTDLHRWLDEHDDTGDVAHIICEWCTPYVIGMIGTTMCGLRKPVEGRWGDPHCPDVRCDDCAGRWPAHKDRHDRVTT